MPTLPLNQETPPLQSTEKAGDPFNTALITQLVNEVFSSTSVFRAPSAPTTLVGIPSLSPDLLWTGSALPYSPASLAPVSDHGLSGGFPATENSSPPPVHSFSDDSQPAGGRHTPSGGHDPEGSDSYAFGEPHSRESWQEDTDRSPLDISDNPPWSASPVHPSNTGLYFLSSEAYSASAVPGAYTSPGPALSTFEVDAIRRDFPALHQVVNGKPLIWLDNAATTHKPQAVIDAISSFYSSDNSNIHRAAHTLAARSTELFENGREKVRQFLGASDAKEIVFVRGTTEGINLVAQTYGRKNIGAGDAILLTTMEHHANIVPWQLLAEQTGAVIRVAPINDRGELILDEFAKLLGPRTKIVALTHVSNARGTINPIEQIIPLAHAHGVPVLVDGAQSTPHFPINVQALDVDFFVFSAHKLFGPTGIGALYGKAHLLEEMPPWQGGGHMIKDVTFAKTTYQQVPEKFEAGTPSIAGVVGLGAAIDYLTRVGLPAIAAYEHALLEYATHSLSSVPGLRPIGSAGEKASVVSFVIPGVSNQHIARHLDKQGIAVRAGHHCAQPALRHFDLESSVRPSLAFYNTFAEVDALVSALHQLPRHQ